MARRERYLVGLDVGTSKIAAIVGEVMDDGNLDIIGIGLADSKGIRRGVVNNVDSAAEAIKKAIDEAELTAGIEIDSVYLALSGAHVKAFNSRGVVAVAGRNREITREDVKRAIDAARAVALPGGREIFHVLPQDFVVDDQDGIAVPVGMTGGRLEVNVHVVTGSSSSMQNMIACVNRAGVEVVDTVLEQLAASESVLTPDEKELGVALVDIGGGTTDFAVFERGSLWHTGVVAVGGDHFTNDIAVGLRMPIPDAEKLKRRSGCALTALVAERRDDGGGQHRRPTRAHDAAPGAVGDPAAAGRRDLPPAVGRNPTRRLREVAELRHRDHRRRRAARGHGGDRRTDFRPAGAPRGARRRRRTGRSRQQSGVRDVGRALRVHASQPPVGASRGSGRVRWDELQVEFAHCSKNFSERSRDEEFMDVRSPKSQDKLRLLLDEEAVRGRRQDQSHRRRRRRRQCRQPHGARPGLARSSSSSPTRTNRRWPPMRRRSKCRSAGS